MSRGITSSACTPGLRWRRLESSDRKLAARSRPSHGVGPLPAYRTLVSLAPCAPNPAKAQPDNAAFHSLHRLLDPTRSARGPPGEDLGRHPRRALLRGMPTPLSRRQGSTTRIARCRVDRSTRCGGELHLAAASTLEAALAL